MLESIRKRKIKGEDFFRFPRILRHEKSVEYYYNNPDFLEKGMKKLNSEGFLGFGKLLKKPDIVAIDYHNRLCLVEILIDKYDKNLRTGKEALIEDEDVLKEIISVIKKISNNKKFHPKYRLFVLSITKNGIILREFKTINFQKINLSEEEVANFIRKVWIGFGFYYIKKDKNLQGIGERIGFKHEDSRFLRKVRNAMAFFGWKTGNDNIDSGIEIKKSGTKILYYNMDGEDFFDKIRPIITKKQMNTLKEAIRWKNLPEKKKKEQIKYFESLLEVLEEMK